MNPCNVGSFDAPEPDDDLGLMAMGLAVAKGRTFRVAHVVLKEHEVAARALGGTGWRHLVSVSHASIATAGT